jgi:hypothetical protein
MRSVMEEHEETGVKVVELDDSIVIERHDELVGSFDGTTEDVVQTAHDWAAGYAQAISDQSGLQSIEQ